MANLCENLCWIENIDIVKEFEEKFPFHDPCIISEHEVVFITKWAVNSTILEWLIENAKTFNLLAFEGGCNYMFEEHYIDGDMVYKFDAKNDREFYEFAFKHEFLLEEEYSYDEELETYVEWSE